MLRLRGEIDMSVEEPVGRCISTLGTGPEPVVVDCSEVTFVDLRGARALFGQDGEIVIRHPPASLLLLLRVLPLPARVTLA